MENTAVMIWPIPAPNGPVNILPPAYSGFSNIRVQLFTAAYRKMLDIVFMNVPSGRAVQVSLVDSWGRPLANGVYYVVVVTSKGRSTAKLVVLR